MGDARGSAGIEAAALGRACVVERTARLWSHQAAVRAGSDAEAVHQMRVDSRRLRALLRVFRAALGAEAVDEARALLRKLGRTLGAVRDIDVLQALSKDIAKRTHRRVGKLDSASRAEALAAVVRLLDSADFARLRTLLSRVVGVRTPAARARGRTAAAPAAVVPPPSGKLRDFAKRAVGRELRRVRRRRKEAVQGEAEGMHALRRALKSLRYAVEALSPLLPARARKLAPTAAMLQDALGAIHDADEWLARAAPSEAAQRLLAADRGEKLAIVEHRLRKLLKKKHDPLAR